MVNDRQNLDLSPFAAPPRRPVEWLISDAPVPYPDAVAAMEARVADIAAGGRRNWSGCWSTPRSTPPAPAARRPTCSMPAFRFCQRARRPAHLSRPRPAGRLCDARSEAAAAGRPRLCRKPRRMDHPHAGGLQRAGRAARGPRRRLGGPAGQGRRLRGQDRRHRRATAALGVVPRHLDQCRAGPDAFLRHRPLRRGRPALRRHQPGRSRPPATMADVDIALRQAFEEVFGPTKAGLPEATV